MLILRVNCVCKKDGKNQYDILTGPACEKDNL